MRAVGGGELELRTPGANDGDRNADVALVADVARDRGTIDTIVHALIDARRVTEDQARAADLHDAFMWLEAAVADGVLELVAARDRRPSGSIVDVGPAQPLVPKPS